MQIRKVPQSCHSGKRWIWILEALSNTNPSKKLTVPTISGFPFWQLDYIERASESEPSDYGNCPSSNDSLGTDVGRQ